MLARALNRSREEVDGRERQGGVVAGTTGTTRTTSRAAQRFTGTLVAGVAGILALTLVLACSSQHEPEPSAELPEGPVVVGDAEAFRRLLAGVEWLRGSPLARGASSVRSRLADCDEFSASPAAGETLALADLLDTVSCDGNPQGYPAMSAMSRLRGSADLAFVLPVGQQGRIAGSARVDAAGSLSVEAEFLELPTGQLARLLAPDSGAIGARRLSGEGALVSARFRPEGGLDLAALVPRGSQADEMFRLRSALFQGAALSGAWEFALYPPSEGGTMPLLALSVDVRVRAAARAGMREFIAELESTWPVHHRAAQFGERGEYSGACFFDLRIMPEFAPCYAETPESIVIAWNPEAIERAVAGDRGVGGLDVAAEAAAAPALGQHAAELVVRFGELSAADDRLRDSLAPGTTSLPLHYFWDRLAVVSGRRDTSSGSAGSAGSVWLRARLRAADLEPPQARLQAALGDAS